jgi:hypothetical protein
MSDDHVRVYARGASLVPDFDAADREPPIRRMIARTYSQVSPGQWGWTPSAEPQAVSKRAEIARALADGDLVPADAATAAWATSITRVPVKFELQLDSGAAGEEQ